MNYLDDDGETYLTIAAQVGDENILKQLLMRGANKLIADVYIVVINLGLWSHSILKSTTILKL